MGRRRILEEGGVRKRKETRKDSEGNEGKGGITKGKGGYGWIHSWVDTYR